MRMKPEDATRVFAEIERIKKNFRTLETLGKPVVSCLNGTALGGGWEVALVGHHRIAVNDPKIQFGMPEVTLGLIPGASGITKMTRQLGLMAAQPYLLEGKLFGPREALEAGLRARAGRQRRGELRAAALAWIAVQPTPRPASIPGTARTTRCPAARPATRRSRRAWWWRPPCSRKRRAACTRRRKPRCAAMVEGAQVDFDTAMRIESRYLAKPDGQPGGEEHDQHVLLQPERDQVAASRRPKDVPRYKPQKVGILGAGMMGAGIAYAQASRGIASVLKDVTQEKAEHGKAYSAKLTQARVDKGRMGPHDQAELLARITPTDQRRRPAGLRPDHRGGVREPRAQGQGHAGGRADAGAGRLLRQQHLHPADQRPGHGQRRTRRSSSASTSSARWTR